MYTALRMQNMVHNCKKNAYFVTQIIVRLLKTITFRALGVESPRGGAIHGGNMEGTWREHEGTGDYKVSNRTLGPKL